MLRLFAGATAAPVTATARPLLRLRLRLRSAHLLLWWRRRPLHGPLSAAGKAFGATDIRSRRRPPLLLRRKLALLARPQSLRARALGAGPVHFRLPAERAVLTAPARRHPLSAALRRPVQLRLPPFGLSQFGLPIIARTQVS
jgi:hypothetical protein